MIGRQHNTNAKGSDDQGEHERVQRWWSVMRGEEKARRKDEK